MFINKKTAYTFKVKIAYKSGDEKIYNDVVAVNRNEESYFIQLKKSWWEIPIDLVKNIEITV
jgi:hypothetical protein